MSTATWTALYVLQALFWLRLVREAGRDLPNPGAQRGWGLQWVGPFEALKFQGLLWLILAASTVWFIIGLIHPAARLMSPRSR